MSKEIEKQVCTLRELVLAHHAYERSLQEFAKSTGVRLTSAARHQLAEHCAELDPREIDGADLVLVVDHINGA